MNLSNIHSAPSLARAVTTYLLPAYKNKNLATRNAWWLITHYMQASQATLLVSQKPIPENIYAQLYEAIIRIVHNNEPIQYVIGSIPFGAITVTVRPPLLIPRPETEMWVADLIELHRYKAHLPLKILDLCTGTGCIALALAKAFPYSSVYATDNNPHAIALSQENAQNNAIINVQWFISDLTQAVMHHGPYDLIVANPPYIPSSMWEQLDPSVRLWEDPHALLAGDDGLTIISRIITDAKDILHTHAELWIEIDETHQEAVLALCAKNRHSHTEIYTDYAGKPRVMRTIMYPKGVIGGQ